MAQPNQESIQESSKDSTTPNPIQVLHHVLNNVLKVKEHEVISISKWMKYMGYNNFTDLCVDLLFELNHVHVFSNYIVDGQYCALKFGTMNELKLFIKWMSTRMKDTTFELAAEYLLALTYEEFNVFRQEDMIRMSIVDGQYCALKFGTMNELKLFIKWMSTRMKDTTFEHSAEYLLALTYEEFNVFRQEDMIRMSSEPTAPPPGPTTPMTPLASQTSGSKRRQAFLSQCDDLLMNLFLNLLKPYLIKKRLILKQSSHFQSSSNSPGSKQDLLGFTFTFMTIILHLIIHLKMWINHAISVTPPAPLIAWMNQVH